MARLIGYSLFFAKLRASTGARTSLFGRGRIALSRPASRAHESQDLPPVCHGARRCARHWRRTGADQRGCKICRNYGAHVVAPAGKADPRAEIVKKVGGIKLEDVRISPVNGIYEVTRDAEISYLSSDGRYAILGDMIDLDSDDEHFRELVAAAFARA